ncbi:MAG: AAA family ATPase [Candidatus Lambdaproteobacteria bacterium]|nr:AAA family ATPase [Candidatus Lambdaproteobacteria bacterium]
MDLFDHARERTLAEKAPLAARMRPVTLEEYVGQAHILGPGRLLRRAIQADQLSSVIFYGPPGTGKTTLARIVAHTTRAHFISINAVLAGVAEIRNAVAEAERLLGEAGRRTILFVDEVHRFNKAQQDALLPHVENGTLILIGATTENPYFEVNKTVLSRSRVFELKPLGEAELATLLGRALADPQRGYGRRNVRLDPDALGHLVRVANGDARAALNALELAVETTPPGADGAADATVHVTLAVAEESIQRRAVLYDKEGDVHFDTISAFIKSLRGSDPDAALYWMARMVYAGEEPRFILRRMLIFAAEDIGLADPNALRVATAAAEAFDYVGMPEGRFHLAEACLYLATAPKSNSTMAFFDALATVQQERAEEVPDPLKDASRDAEGFGHGQGYQYPHAFRDHWVAQQYLPASLQGRLFYQPGALGFEAGLAERVQRLREAQLAALREAPGALADHFAGGNPAAATALPGEAPDAWRLRTHSTLGEHLEALRVRAFELAEVGRHHLVLDANAGAGLFTWEALRRATEGGVWCRVETPQQARELAEQARGLSALAAPVIVQGAPEALPELIRAQGQGQGQGQVRFDRVLARGLLGRDGRQAERIALLAGLLAPAGRLLLVETVPRLGERLFAQAGALGLPEELAKQLAAAEEALYAEPDDPALAWSDEHLARWCGEAGLTPLRRERLARLVEFPLTPALLARWFGGPGAEGTPGVGRLAARLGSAAERVRRALLALPAATTLRRRTVVALVLSGRPA